MDYATRNSSPERILTGFASSSHVSRAPLLSRVGTRFVIDGFEPVPVAVVRDGCIAVVDRADVVAASWSFAKVLTHSRNRHQTVFVPTIVRNENDGPACRGADEVLLGEGTTFVRLLSFFGGCPSDTTPAPTWSETMGAMDQSPAQPVSIQME